MKNAKLDLFIDMELSRTPPHSKKDIEQVNALLTRYFEITQQNKITANKFSPLEWEPAILKERNRLERDEHAIVQAQHAWNIPLRDAHLIQTILLVIQPKLLVEIGASNGYSSLWIASALRTYGGRMISIEIDPGRAEMARKNQQRAGIENTATIMVGDALKVLPTLEEEIDALFLDAPGTPYSTFLQTALPRMKKGGLIIAHNMAYPSPETRYVKMIKHSPELESIFVNMDAAGVGVTLKG